MCLLNDAPYPLHRLLRHTQAVDALLKFDDLSLLFSAISSPCSSYNKIWRKASVEAVMTVCKYSLSGTGTTCKWVQSKPVYSGHLGTH